MPSFNLGSKPAAKQEVARPILRSIGNQDDSKKLKATKPLADIKTAAAAPALAPVALTAKVAAKLDADVRPMDVDLPRTTWPALPPGVEDIDDEEADNPLLVAEYVNDIYAYMRDLEVRHAVPDNYMALSQRESGINEKMRAILVDWLVEVHMRFKLLQETLFMTIDILDRFLAVHQVTRAKLQLVGITAMLIASKYEEMYPPEVRDFVFIADNAYTRAEIFAMEALILRKLDFNLGTPLPLHFLRRFSRACHADTTVHTLAKYFMELKMMSYAMIKYKASETAAAAIWMARKVCDGSAAWTPTMVHYSGYSEAAIEPCIAALQAELAHTLESAQQAVRRKYASPKLFKASDLPELAAYIKTL